MYMTPDIICIDASFFSNIAYHLSIKLVVALCSSVVQDELQQKVDELSKRVQELEESKNAKPEGTEQHESNTGSTE